MSRTPYPRATLHTERERARDEARLQLSAAEQAEARAEQAEAQAAELHRAALAARAAFAGGEPTRTSGAALGRDARYARRLAMECEATQAALEAAQAGRATKRAARQQARVRLADAEAGRAVLERDRQRHDTAERRQRAKLEEQELDDCYQARRALGAGGAGGGGGGGDGEA